MSKCEDDVREESEEACDGRVARCPGTRAAATLTAATLTRRLADGFGARTDGLDLHADKRARGSRSRTRARGRPGDLSALVDVADDGADFRNVLLYPVLKG